MYIYCNGTCLFFFINIHLDLAVAAAPDGNSVAPAAVAHAHANGHGSELFGCVENLFFHQEDDGGALPCRAPACILYIGSMDYMPN